MLQNHPSVWNARLSLVAVIIASIVAAVAMISLGKVASAHHADYEPGTYCGDKWHATAVYTGGSDLRLILMDDVVVNGEPYDGSWANATVESAGSFGGPTAGLSLTPNDFVYVGGESFTIFDRGTSDGPFQPGPSNWSGTIKQYFWNDSTSSWELGGGGEFPDTVEITEPLASQDCDVTPTPTNTPVTPTSTPVTPTSTPVTPTSTPVTPTSTPITPTSTPVTPTSTPVTPTSTPVTPTSTPVTPTSTPVTPTSTPVTPTSTPITPTSTPVTPTSTPVTPTSTPVTPTSTPVTPTSTPQDPTNTPVPPTNTPVPPTSTPVNEVLASTPTLVAEELGVSSLPNTGGGFAGGGGATTLLAIGLGMMGAAGLLVILPRMRRSHR